MIEAQLYGLRLRSNCPLPGTIPVSAGEPPDVHFELIEGPSSSVPQVAAIKWEPEPVFETENGLHRVWSGTGDAGSGDAGTFWRLWYGSDAFRQSIEFVIHPSGRNVWAWRQTWDSQGEWDSQIQPASLHDVTTLLLGSVFGVVLRLRGTLCLHASVIALGTQAILILGDKGTGKSTTAAALAERGHAILSDDIAAITMQDGTLIVHPGYPRLRLWPTALHALQQPTSGLAPVLPTLEKRYLELAPAEDGATWRFQSQSLPLGTIYLLARDPELTAPIVEPLAAPDRLTTLITHTSVRFLNLDKARAAQEFAGLGRLAATLPVCDIQCPEGLEHLPALCEAMMNGSRRVTHASQTDHSQTDHEDALQKAIRGATTFLLNARDPDGSWHDFPDVSGGSDAWVTGFVGTALATLPEHRARWAARHAWSLLEERHQGAGWGFNSNLPVDADSTTWALRLAAALGIETCEHGQQARRALEEHRLPNGGLSSYREDALPRPLAVLSQTFNGSYDGWCRTAHACISAAAAMLGDERLLDFLRHTQRDDGSWPAYWWEADEYSTALGAEALARAGRPEDQAHVQAAVGWTLKRMESTGMDSAFVTAWRVRLLVLAEDPAVVRESLEYAIQCLLHTQRGDGSWPPAARMRSPWPDVLDPGASAGSHAVFLDQAGIFTTATVLSALEAVRVQANGLTRF